MPITPRGPGSPPTAASADDAANAAGNDHIVVLHGIHLFRISRATASHFSEGVRLWVGADIYRDCPSIAAATAHHDEILDRHRLRGGMNAELPSAFGYVSNERNEAVAYISPNGRIWHLSYLGAKGGPLVSEPFVMSR